MDVVLDQPESSLSTRAAITGIVKLDWFPSDS